MTNSSASKPTTLNVNLAITHVDGSQPSMQEVLSWLSRCVNCNPNHARVEITNQSLVVTRGVESDAGISSEALAPMNDAQYLAKMGRLCPCCHADDISGQEIEVDNATAFQSVSCLKCGANWVDDYVLSGYSNLDGGIDFSLVKTVLQHVERSSITDKLSALAEISNATDILDVRLSDAEHDLVFNRLLPAAN